MRIESDRVVYKDNELDWTPIKGDNAKEHRKRILFKQAFEKEPVVRVTLAHLDILNAGDTHIGVEAFEIDETGFDLSCQTWGTLKLQGLELYGLPMATETTN